MTCLHYWISRSEHRDMTWLNYITNTSWNKHRGIIHNIYKWINSEVTNTSTLPLNWEGIISTQVISTSLLLCIIWIIIKSSSSSIHLHLQVIFIIKSSSFSSHLHQVWIITWSGASLDHHLIWIVTRSSSSLLLSLSQSNGAISSFFLLQEFLQSQPFFMLVVGLASM